MSHQAVDELWERRDGSLRQYPVALGCVEGEPLISFGGGSFVPYPPEGWIRREPPWDPLEGPDPDPPEPWSTTP